MKEITIDGETFEQEKIYNYYVGEKMKYYELTDRDEKAKLPNQALLEKDPRFNWVLNLHENWVNRADKIEIKNQSDMNIYGLIYDMADELLCCASKEKGSLKP